MRIKNFNKRGSSVVTSMGIVFFDENGIADVDENLGDRLIEMKGYEIAFIDFDIDSTDKFQAEQVIISSENGIPEEQIAIDPISEATATRNFESMTVEQLRQYARDNSIDIKSATRKSDIIAIINQRV